MTVHNNNYAAEMARKAREVLKAFTTEQIGYAQSAYSDMLDCWNIDATDEDAVSNAMRATDECMRDWASIAAEDGVVDSFEDFEMLVKYVDMLDMRSMAYC